MNARPAAAGRSARKRTIRRLFLLLSVGSVLILLALCAGSCWTVRIPESGSRQRVLFYAAATDLSPGAPLDLKDLEQRLQRLGYRPAAATSAPDDSRAPSSRSSGRRGPPPRDKRPPEAAPLASGQYRMFPGGAEIFLRPFQYPGRAFRGGRLRLRASGGTVLRVQPIDPIDAVDLRLEPERIAGFEGETGAVLGPLRLEEAPPLLVKAIIEVEDHRFYHHPGIDPIGMVRALFTNMRHHQIAQGGSTLTQQLARSLYLHNQKTVFRKLQEAMLAIGLELHYSKREILEAYLNAVYWGNWGAMEIRGAREASRYYLGTELEKADPAGIALLVGLIPAPNAFSPYNSPERALARRNFVLRKLEKKGILGPDEVRAAMAEPLPSRRAPYRAAEASYFLEAARQEVERRGPSGILNKPGTAVFTTLDPRDQAAAVAAVRQGLQDLERNHRRLRRADDPLQAALVSIDPETGEVRALVGGRDFVQYPFNRAIDAHRQPGSLFKPFVYLAAFQRPEREDGSYWTPATILDDEPLDVEVGRKTWSPQNYDREFRGQIPLRTALEQSLNVPTARVGMEVGIRNVVRAAQSLGIQSPLSAVPSLALGTSDVSLLEITGAYAALAAQGEAHAPTLLRAVVGPDGRQASLSPLDDAPGVNAAPAYVLTNILRGVIEEGTARTARSLGVRGDVAGKTGTTDDYRDAWFVGYTPRRAIGVWVGFDQEDVVGLSGAAAALPIWAAAMRASEGPAGDGNFERPQGVVEVTIDPETGLLATPDCPSQRDEAFLEGTEPTETCDRHGGGFLNRLGRLFGF